MLHPSTTAELLGEVVFAMISTILSLVWDVLSKVLGNYIYDRFFKVRK